MFLIFLFSIKARLNLTLTLNGFSPTLAAQKGQKSPYKHRDRTATSYATPSAVQHSPPRGPGPAGTKQSNICSGLAETGQKASQLRPREL